MYICICLCYIYIYIYIYIHTYTCVCIQHKYPGQFKTKVHVFILPHIAHILKIHTYTHMCVYKMHVQASSRQKLVCIYTSAYSTYFRKFITAPQYQYADVELSRLLCTYLDMHACIHTYTQM